MYHISILLKTKHVFIFQNLNFTLGHRVNSNGKYVKIYTKIDIRGTHIAGIVVFA